MPQCYSVSHFQPHSYFPTPALLSISFLGLWWGRILYLPHFLNYLFPYTYLATENEPGFVLWTWFCSLNLIFCQDCSGNDPSTFLLSTVICKTIICLRQEAISCCCPNYSGRFSFLYSCLQSLAWAASSATVLTMSQLW